MRDELEDPQRRDAPQKDGCNPALAPAGGIQLRVMATTDLHMQLLGHDYVADQMGPHHGLAGLSTLVAEARTEAAAMGSATLLLDNGDLLQGSSLGDDLSRRPVGPDHPLAASMNHLGYDAIGLGNHDLDYGQDYLQAFAAQLKMPVICSNLALKKSGAVRPEALLQVPLPKGGAISVGLLSVLPQETAIWNCHRLGPEDRLLATAEALRAAIPRLRRRGAQIILLMAHLGIEVGSPDDALDLSRIEGIDLMITGHTHRRFPGQDHPRQPDLDPVTGLLSDRPAIMPGCHGSDLGILDLTFEVGEEGHLTRIGHGAHLRANGPALAPDPAIQRLCLTAHNRLRKGLQEPVGETWVPLHNFFSLVSPTPTCGLIARAQAQVIREALKERPEGKLPLLAAVPAHTAGGRGGPQHYLHVPQGPILRRHLSGLTPYADQIWAIRINGRGLQNWLEHSARVFCQLFPDDPDQILLDPRVPSFDFDTIYGLTYSIDPTQPTGGRISRLRYAGRDVHPEKDFILVTSQFRAAGGGGHGRAPQFEVIHRSKEAMESALIEEVRYPKATLFEEEPPWHFSCRNKVRATLETAPSALWYLQQIAHLSPVVMGQSSDGFARLRLTL